jgi:hypothetical protein
MKQNRDNLWVVVEVESGNAVDARAYRTESAAARRISYRRARLNLHDDDIQVFEVKLPKR